MISIDWIVQQKYDIGIIRMRVNSEKEKMNKQELTNAFIKRIEQERVKRGWKQYELAEKLDMSLPGYRKMISGQTDSVSLYTAYKASILFEMSISSMCAGDKKNEIIDKLYQVQESVCDRVSYYLDCEKQLALAYQALKIKEKMIDVLETIGFMRDGMQVNSYIVEKKIIKDIYDEEIHKGIKVTENSYIPVYAKGDILLINENIARNGDIALLMHTKSKRLFLRKVIMKDSYECHPVNGRGEIFLISEEERKEWIDCGHVVTVLHT